VIDRREAMKIHQLSLFLENQPGKAVEPCRLLARAGVNIRTLTLADTQQFGILRLIVPIGREAGCSKRPGMWSTRPRWWRWKWPTVPAARPACWKRCSRTSGVNIEYMYAFPFGREGRAVMIFRFDRPDAAIEHLRAAGIDVVDSVDVYNKIS
jgi:hypothetical protein